LALFESASKVDPCGAADLVRLCLGKDLPPEAREFIKERAREAQGFGSEREFRIWSAALRERMAPR
jgi:hypothetical protein